MAQQHDGDWLELLTSDGGVVRVHKTAHPRSRRLRLTVGSKGARLSYPPGTSAVQIHAFLRHQSDWLVQKLEELNLSTSPPPLRVGHATEIFLRGERVTLGWAEGPYPRIELDTAVLTVVLPKLQAHALTVARGLLVTHLEAQIRRDVARWMPVYVPQLGAAPTALKVRPMKSLWGSLDSRDRINLDLALAMAPPAVLRYVLVHELCHLRVRSHAPRFWALVGAIFPHWRAQRDWLRANGAQLKAELERLVMNVA